MDAAVLKTLKRIRKEAPRRFSDLRNTCDEIIGMLVVIFIFHYLFVLNLGFVQSCFNARALVAQLH